MCNSTVGIPKGLASSLFPLAVRTKRCTKFIILAVASANALRFMAILSRKSRLQVESQPANSVTRRSASLCEDCGF